MVSGTTGALNSRAPNIRPSIEVELKGKERPMASILTFKFVGLKTLEATIDKRGDINIPSRVFFTQKFYNFKESKTD